MPINDTSILVDRYINTSYDVVKKVHDNLDELLIISNINNINISADAGAAYICDLNEAVHWILTLEDNTAISFSNVPIATRTARISLRLVQDVVGDRVPSFPAGWRWDGGVVPTWGTLNGNEDIVEAFTEDGGSVWRANLLGQNYT